MKKIDLVLPIDAYIPSLAGNQDFYYSIKENKDFLKSLKEQGKYEIYLKDEKNNTQKYLGNYEHDKNKFIANIEDISNYHWKDILEVIKNNSNFNTIEENFKFKNNTIANLEIDNKNNNIIAKFEKFNNDNREKNFSEFIENIEQIPRKFYEEFTPQNLTCIQKNQDNSEFSCTITPWKHLKELKIIDKEKTFEISAEEPEKANMKNLEINEAMLLKSSNIQTNAIGKIGELIEERANDFEKIFLIETRRNPTLKEFNKENEKELFKCIKAYKQTSKVPLATQKSTNALTLLKEFPNETFIDKECKKQLKFDNKKLYITTNKSISYDNKFENIIHLLNTYQHLSKLKEFEEFKNRPIILNNNNIKIEINNGNLKQLSGNLKEEEKNNIFKNFNFKNVKLLNTNNENIKKNSKSRI